jgi:MOSC domain-containing protein YiiM
VAREREGRLGVYASTVTPGRIALRDEVAIESTPCIAPRRAAMPAQRNRRLYNMFRLQ